MSLLDRITPYDNQFFAEHVHDITRELAIVRVLKVGPNPSRKLQEREGVEPTPIKVGDHVLVKIDTYSNEKLDETTYIVRDHGIYGFYKDKD